jgi:stage III sporulation protein AE
VNRLLLWSITILMVLIMPSGLAAATEEVPLLSLEETMKSLDFSVLEEYKNNVDGEINFFMERKPVKEWITDFIKGDWEFDISTAGESCFRFFFREVAANSSLLGKLLILSIVAALLVNLQTAFSTGVARVSYLTCFLALAAIAIGTFKVVLAIGQQTIDNMVTFMMGMLPQMLILTAGMGNINSSVMLFPVLMTTSTALANAINNIVFPLIIMSAILSMVNHMSDSLKVEKMAKFFTQMAQISLGFFFTIFVGLVTLRAIYASVLDKVALRTTKFIADNAIPVVGKMFSDTIEVAAGYVLMLKQALGVLGVIIVLGIIALPVLKIAAIFFIYKIAAAIAEPLGDSKTAGILETMGSHLLLMMAAVTTVGLMFFIMIAIVAGLSNQMVLLR